MHYLFCQQHSKANCFGNSLLAFLSMFACSQPKHDRQSGMPVGVHGGLHFAYAGARLLRSLAGRRQALLCILPQQSCLIPNLPLMQIAGLWNSYVC